MAVVELGLDLVAGTAGAPGSLLGRVLGQRIAALDHEILDDPVKAGAVVESLLRERLEILDRLRGDVRPKLNDHFAFGGLDDGDFLRIHRAFLVFRLGFRPGLRSGGCRFVCFLGLGCDQIQRYVNGTKCDD